MGIYPVRVKVLEAGNLTRIPLAPDEAEAESSTTPAPPLATTPRHRSDIPPEEEYVVDDEDDPPSPTPEDSPDRPTPPPPSAPPSAPTVAPIHSRETTMIPSKWMEETLDKVQKVVDSVLRSIGQVNTTLPGDDDGNSTAGNGTSWRPRHRGGSGGEGTRRGGGRGERRKGGGAEGREEEEGEGGTSGNGGDIVRIPERNSTQEETNRETSKGRERGGARRGGGRRRGPGRKGSKGRAGGRRRESARRQIDKAESGGKTNGGAVSGTRTDNNSSDGERLGLSEGEMTRANRSKAHEFSSKGGLGERTHRGRGDVGIEDTENYANLMQNDDHSGSASLSYSKRNHFSDKCDSECKAQNTPSKRTKRATTAQNGNASEARPAADGTSRRTTPAPNSTNLASASLGSDTDNQDNRSPGTPASSSKQTISSVTDLLFVVPNEIVIKPAENSKVQSEIKSTEKLIRTSLEDLFFRVPVDSNRQQPHDGADGRSSQDSESPEVNTEPSVATTLRELTRPDASVATVTSTTAATPTQFQDEMPSQSTPMPHSGISGENKTDPAAKGTKENGERTSSTDKTENGKSKSNSFTQREKLILRTACLPVGSLGRFQVQDTTYQVRGMGAEHIAAECWREVSNVVNDHIKLPYLDETTLVATTAFYFIAASANLIGK